MKRFLIILGLMCLLFDLAHDGSIGQIEHELRWTQCSSVTARPVSFDRLQAFPVKGNLVTLLPSYVVKPDGNFRHQQVAVEVTHPRKIVYRYHFFSSGGIPS